MIVRRNRDRSRVGFVRTNRTGPSTIFGLDSNLTNLVSLSTGAELVEDFCLSGDGTQVMARQTTSNPGFNLYQAGNLLASISDSDRHFTWNGGSKAYHGSFGTSVDVNDVPSLTALPGLTIPALSVGQCCRPTMGLTFSSSAMVASASARCPSHSKGQALRPRETRPMSIANLHIENLKVKNFKAFQNTQLSHIPKVCLLVGKNGVGKSTVFDIFGFLKDALATNVTKALNRRGGYSEVVTRGQSGPIEIEIKFRESGGRLATYSLKIGQDGPRGVVVSEILKFRRGARGQPWQFLSFAYGKGSAIVNEESYGSEHIEAQREEQSLDSADILAIKGLGQFQRFRVASDFRKLIENWHVSDFHIADARPSPEEGEAEHLSSRGENLSLVARNLFEYHRDVFDEILKRMAERVPGVVSVQAEPTVDGRIVLKFQDGAFKDPFIARHVSDGTIKMFAYLVLLHDPSPFPLLAIEEPENQLYPQLLAELWEEFESYASRGGQVFASTHSPDLLNRADLENIYILEKNQGTTSILKASDQPQLVALIAQGDRPGELWRQGLLVGEV
jgi:predicted ATPase